MKYTVHIKYNETESSKFVLGMNVLVFLTLSNSNVPSDKLSLCFDLVFIPLCWNPLIKTISCTNQKFSTNTYFIQQLSSLNISCRLHCSDLMLFVTNFNFFSALCPNFDVQLCEEIFMYYCIFSYPSDIFKYSKGDSLF